jgi:tetratricopeptide (TPR) repeat protein
MSHRAGVLSLVRVCAAASAAIACSTTGLAAPQAAARSRAEIEKLVAEIRRADYEGDRQALLRLYTELSPDDREARLSSRVRYWRGFALWRRAVNGFNDMAPAQELEKDSSEAIAEFKLALQKDPAFLDAKIGEIACIGNLAYLNQAKPDRMRELIAESSPLIKEAMAADSAHPRLLWVMGPIYWSLPPERGGGQDKALKAYDEGLASIRRSSRSTDALEPSWGEPELLMNRAWSNLHRTAPDLKSAEADARAALALVPDWHYVRDLLLPQIQDEQRAQQVHN